MFSVILTAWFLSINIRWLGRSHESRCYLGIEPATQVNLAFHPYWLDISSTSLAGVKAGHVHRWQVTLTLEMWQRQLCI